MLGQVLQEYRGRVRLIYKDFPLPGHPGARPAAEAARCAGAQGAFWPYHDLLFQDQRAFTRGDLVGYAQRLGLDRAAFVACLDGGRFRDAVDTDLRQGEGAGVRATPTFFINGRKVEGALPVETFRSLIEQALAGRGGRP